MSSSKRACIRRHLRTIGWEAVASVGGKGVGLIKKDEIFGEMSMLTGTALYRHRQSAKTQCFVQKTSTSDFEALVRSRPSLMAQIASKLAERLVGANKMVASRGTTKRPSRIRKNRTLNGAELTPSAKSS